MKFPGVYAAYALVMAVFGETIAGIRIGLLIVNAATILLVFLLARRLTEPLSATAAAASFAFLSLGQPVLGSFAHATHTRGARATVAIRRDSFPRCWFSGEKKRQAAPMPG